MAATILEEVLRDSKDCKKDVYSAYLDAKSAFDVVNHNSLLRKLYLAGVGGKSWEVIQDLHSHAVSCIKWNGQLSDSFQIMQGVRQGGLLSTELYKVYVNDLLNRIQDTGLGSKIGTTDCSAPTCADYVTILTNGPDSLQTLLDVAVDYSSKERYLLQPAKSAVLVVPSLHRAQSHTQPPVFRIGDEQIKVQNRTTYLGIQRDTKSTTTATVDSTIQKARRRMYSLMKPGLHGENGLDPITLHLLTVYVLPILLYGLEICLPKGPQLKRLEIFLKKIIKQLLSLPVTTADAAVYVLTGILPAEAQIQQKVLIHFGAITRLPRTSLERKIAYRQLILKDESSTNWFQELRRITGIYSLPDPLSILETPPSSWKWKQQVRTAINTQWKEAIILKAHAYSSLRHLNVDAFTPGSHHPILITTAGNSRDVTRLQTRLLLATGTYILR